MIKQVYCKNLNHGRMLVNIQYCPDCGEKFNVKTEIQHCTETIHGERRKNRYVYCCDCGIKISSGEKK